MLSKVVNTGLSTTGIACQLSFLPISARPDNTCFNNEGSEMAVSLKTEKDIKRTIRYRISDIEVCLGDAVDSETNKEV